MSQEYRDDDKGARGGPTPIREILAEITAALALRLERQPGVAHLVRAALAMRRAGADGFAAVEPLLLVAELAELLGDEESAP